MTIFYCPRFETPQYGRPGSRTCIPKEQVCSVIAPQALSTLFFASNYSKGYGGDIRPRSTRATVDSQLAILVITSWHGPRRKHCSSYCSSVFAVGICFVCEAVNQQRLLFICLSRSRCSTTGLHAIVSYQNFE
jgi:hypothetical protein